jgi:hypothetical protein
MKSERANIIALGRRMSVQQAYAWLAMTDSERAEYREVHGGGAEQNPGEAVGYTRMYAEEILSAAEAKFPDGYRSVRL